MDVLLWEHDLQPAFESNLHLPSRVRCGIVAKAQEVRNVVQGPRFPDCQQRQQFPGLVQ
ncbi:MAG: hypothetical protein HOZ81_32800 [Streptomyces sp.]|nr:hypothetical protein [Streptomyces sp.]NUS89455.1 hypothetical protein [Streptomyces sp.]